MLARKCAIACISSIRRRRLEQYGGRAKAHRERHGAAEPEGEADRRAADEDVVGAGLQDRAREAVADREHVAVKVHRALGLAGGARGERDQGDIVGGGRDVLEAGRSSSHAPLELGAATGAARAIERADALAHRRLCARPFELLAQALVAQRQRDLRLVDDGRELARPQQRHGRDSDAAGLEHGEPAGHQHGIIGRAQQDPVARHQPQIVLQHVGDAVGVLEQLAVGPALVRAVERDLFAQATFDRTVEQLNRAVQARRVAQLRQLETQVRPKSARWQVIAREAVEMSRVA